MSGSRFLGSLVVIGALAGCGSDNTVVTPPPPPVPAHIEIVSGNGQSGTANTTLSTPLTVRVTDAKGIVLSHVLVNWEASAGAGVVSVTQNETNNYGLATAAWTLGTTLGDETLNATIAAPQTLAVVFHATALAAPPPTPPTPPPSPHPIILHSDGTAWSASLVLTGVKGTAIWGLGPSQVYAGIFGCPDVITYTGGTWPSGSCNVYSRQIWGIWGPAPDHLYAIERGLGRPLNQPQYVYHFDGSTWNIVYNNGGSTLLAISGVGTTEVIAVGQSGRIVRLLGSDWTAQTSGTTQDLRAVWGDPAGSGAFAVGTGGTILHYDGTTWTAQSSPTTQHLNGVWGSSAHDVFAVGENGTILHYDGTAWTQQTSGTTANLNAVWAGPNTVIAVGDNGTTLRYDGTSWNPENSGVTTRLVAIWGSSGHDVFVMSE